MAGIHFETKGPGPVSDLFPAGIGLLLAVHLHEIGVPVLRLVRLDGRIEDIRSKLDLEVKGVV